MFSYISFLKYLWLFEKKVLLGIYLFYNFLIFQIILYLISFVSPFLFVSFLLLL